MSEKWLIVMGAVCLLFFCNVRSCGAEVLTGLQLYDSCKLVGIDSAKLSNENLLSANTCLYYVVGVLEGYESGVKPEKQLICLPAGISNGQIGLVVSKYLDTHPERLHTLSRFLVLDALHEAFPCKPPLSK